MLDAENEIDETSEESCINVSINEVICDVV